MTRLALEYSKKNSNRRIQIVFLNETAHFRAKTHFRWDKYVEILGHFGTNMSS